ncbi:MAG: hypothetical protein M0Z39_11115 [Actinomycetota bacterium]|nr:hypothetical protein [Actinomycetota bacterium]
MLVYVAFGRANIAEVHVAVNVLHKSCGRRTRRALHAIYYGDPTRRQPAENGVE